MKVFFKKEVQWTLSSVFAILLFVAAFSTPPLPARAEPVSVAIASVVFVTTAVIAACQLNAFGICPPATSKGKGGKKPSNSTTVTPVTPVSGDSKGTTDGTKGGAPSGQICTSAPNAVCGITSQGILVGGVCNAVTPSNSACPAPVIDETSGFYADPALVRSGSTSNLHWNAANATTCNIAGGGLSLNGLGVTGSTLTGTITGKTTYTLTCLNGAGGSSSSVNATVNLIPSVQEQ
jgi:hypothetical protein